MGGATTTTKFSSSFSSSMREKKETRVFFVHQTRRLPFFFFLLRINKQRGEGGKKNEEDAKNRRKKNRSRRSSISFVFFCSSVLPCLCLLILRLKISPYQRKEKKCLSQKKSLFFFSTSRRIKHALKTRNTRHYLDLKYTFLIHTYFK